jgi:DNA-binding beta-propeller fold protein YncE
MIRIRSLGLLVSAMALGAAPALAAEELSQDALVVQAKIKKLGDVMGFGFDALWSMSNDHLIRINAADNSFVDINVKGGGGYRPPAIGEGAVWIADINAMRILKLDPATNSVVMEMPAEMLQWQGTLGVGDGSVWVMTQKGGFDKQLTRYNAATGAIESTLLLPSIGTGVLFDSGSVWVAGSNNEVYRVDPKSNMIAATIGVHKQPLYLCAGEGAVWVWNQGDGMVDRIDPATNTVIDTIDSEFPSIHGGDFDCGGGYVWADQPSMPLVQIDPKTNTTIRKFSGQKGFGWGVRYGAGSLWFSGASIQRVEPPKYADTRITGLIAQFQKKEAR